MSSITPSGTAETPDSGPAGDNADLDATTRLFIKKTNEIMDKISQMNRFTLADFFYTLFNHSGQLSSSAQGTIIQWLAANTCTGTRPAEIIDAIYRRPHSLRTQERVLRTAALDMLTLYERPGSARSDRIISFLPPQPPEGVAKDVIKALYNSREGIEEWAARVMVFRANQEANRLETVLAPGGSPTWSKLIEYSWKAEQTEIRANAPLLWATLSAVALNRKRLAQKNRGSADINSVMDSESNSELDSSSDEGEAPATTAERRDEDKAVTRAKKKTDRTATFTIQRLLGQRNRRLGVFRAYTGIFLFSTNTHKDTFRILSRLGVSPAYNTVRDQLKALAQSAKELLRDIGRRAYDSAAGDVPDPQFFWFNFDNINKYVIPRSETVGNKSQIRNGTAATVIIMEDVPPGAFKRDPYIKNLEAGCRQELTVEGLYEDIDYKHLSNVGIGTVMRILARSILALKKLRKPVDKLFEDTEFCAQHPLRLRKSRIHPMGTSAINEATVEGASNVIDDLVQQMGMSPEWFNDLLVPVGGDQLSVDRTRRAIGYLDQEESVFDQKSWVLPLIQPWHMGWAYMKAVMRTHWYEPTGKGTLGLRRAVGMLGRHLNAEKCEYYPTFNAITTVFETMVLSAARVILRRDHSDVAVPDNNGKSMQLLEELEFFFSADGPLGECSIDTLRELATHIHDEYLTTQSYHASLSGPAPTHPPAETIKEALMHNMQGILALEAESLASGSSHSRRHKTGPVALLDSKSLLDGDLVLSNAKLFMRDALYLIEFADAMDNGDPGRMFKIMDVWRFSFWGNNSTNYGSELLEMACNFKYDYPEPLKAAIMNNYLVNPSGLPGHWQAGDLLQEHYKKEIKNIFNSKSMDFDEPFMRESVSLNVAGFSAIKHSMLRVLGLARTGQRHASTNYRADINVLGAHFEEEKFFKVTPGRSQPYQPVDMVAAGYTKLSEGALQSFLDRTLGDRTAVRVAEGEEAEVPAAQDTILSQADPEAGTQVE